MSAPKARAADWTEERGSEGRASERRGKLGGFERAGGARQTLLALHAEWTKLRTLASTGWLLLGVAALTIAVSAATDAAAACPAGG